MQFTICRLLELAKKNPWGLGSQKTWVSLKVRVWIRPGEGQTHPWDVQARS